VSKLFSYFRKNSILAVLFALTACDGPAEKESFSDKFEAPEYLVEHGKMFKEGVSKVSDAPVWLYTNINGGIPNTAVIEGDEGLIVIDTTLKMADGEKTVELIRERTQKPIIAVIYTHHHPDHIGGTQAFVSAEDAANGTVPVIAADNFPKEMIDENAVTAQIMGLRALYMYGTLLDPETDGKDYHVGLGGQIKPGQTATIPANTFVPSEGLTVTLAGIDFEFFKTGGEAASHIGVYLPAYDLILSGDEIQGPTFPNLHSLRGTKPRDAENWLEAIDRMRTYTPKILVPSHGPIVEGEAEVERILVTYRDAIQWTHDQSVRLINEGKRPEELAELLPELPEHLTISPWTREMYGTVKHSARNYYTGYISWWDGDPATLDPTPRVEAAKRRVKLVGGRVRIISEAQAALTAGDPQWASELLTDLITTDNQDTEARHLKARALRQIGYKTLNTNWRGFYLTAARELEGKIDSVEIMTRMRGTFSPENIGSKQLLSLLRYRLVPDEAGDKTLTINFIFPDKGDAVALELRNQILVVHEGTAKNANGTITMNRSIYDQMMRLETTFGKALLAGEVDIEGSKLDILSFFGSFDMETKPIHLVGR
jgi:alkyl sulfatase BDS1-like metallo-beta-lactamase superfamily hydrolase